MEDMCTYALRFSFQKGSCFVFERRGVACANGFSGLCLGHTWITCVGVWSLDFVTGSHEYPTLQVLPASRSDSGECSFCIYRYTMYTIGARWQPTMTAWVWVGWKSCSSGQWKTVPQDIISSEPILSRDIKPIFHSFLIPITATPKCPSLRFEVDPSSDGCCTRILNRTGGYFWSRSSLRGAAGTLTSSNSSWPTDRIVYQS